MSRSQDIQKRIAVIKKEAMVANHRFLPVANSAWLSNDDPVTLTLDLKDTFYSGFGHKIQIVIEYTGFDNEGKFEFPVHPSGGTAQMNLIGYWLSKDKKLKELLFKGMKDGKM
jgi:hypothetical protein